MKLYISKDFVSYVVYQSKTDVKAVIVKKKGEYAVSSAETGEVLTVSIADDILKIRSGSDEMTGKIFFGKPRLRLLPPRAERAKINRSGKEYTLMLRNDRSAVLYCGGNILMETGKLLRRTVEVNCSEETDEMTAAAVVALCLAMIESEDPILL